MKFSDLSIAALLIGAFSLNALAVAGPPPPARADKARSSITYTCVHTLHEWSGVDRSIDAVLVRNDAGQVTKVAASGKVADFDSGNSNRDSHALEVLEALKFPKVTFVSTRIVPDGAGLQVEGSLTFHGVTRPVTLVVSQQETKSEVTYKGQFQIKLTDFGVDPPSFMLVKTNDDMKLNLEMVFPR
jgi:polyisoprenoid-binding protein YceI